MSPSAANPKSNRQRTARARGRASARRSVAQPPTAADIRRYMDWRAGISEAELAARENVRVSTITASIDRMRNFAAANSAEMSELNLRSVAREILPEAKVAIQGAFSATRMLPVTTGYDEDGNPITDYMEVADHATRLAAVDRVRTLFTAAQPKQPLLSLTNNNTVNNQQNNLHAGGAGAEQRSAEAIIRQIRAERGLALPSEATADMTASAPALVEQDMELEDDLEDSDDGDSQDIEEGEYDEEDEEAEDDAGEGEDSALPQPQPAIEV